MLINCRNASWFVWSLWRRPTSHRQMCRTTSAARSERRTHRLRTWTRSRSPRAQRFAPRSSSRWSSSWSRIDVAPVSYIRCTASIKRRWAARSLGYRSIVARTWVRHPAPAGPYRRWLHWAPTTLKRSGTKCRPTAIEAYHGREFSLLIDKVNYCLHFFSKNFLKKTSIEFTTFLNLYFK